MSSTTTMSSSTLLLSKTSVLLLTFLVFSSLIPSSSQSLLVSSSSSKRQQHVPKEEEQRFDVNTDSNQYSVRPVYPGLDPLFGKLSLSSYYLSRRDCLENGSNYCFGNSVDFCPSCGTCCSSSTSQWCCADATSTCCGSGCCATGEVCSEDGRCFSTVVTTTVTSTVVTTVTHTATRLESVEVEVDQVSTVDEVVTITVSDVDTATEVIYTTTTVVARRGLHTEVAATQPRTVDGLAPAAPSVSPSYFSSLFRRLVWKEDDDDEPSTPFAPRFDPIPWTYSENPGDAKVKVVMKRQESTVTTIISVTSTVDVTITASSAVTGFSTSTSLTTRSQTRTIVLSAKKTVSITSTIAETLRQPTTRTSTAVLTIKPSAASESSSSSSTSSAHLAPTTPPSPQGSSLPTSTIIGISVGSGVGGIFLFGILFAIWRVRRRKRRYYPGMTTVSMSGGGGDHLPTYPYPSPPRQFVPSPPAHHNVEFSAFTRKPRSSLAKSNLSSGQTTVLQGGGGGRDRSSTGTHNTSYYGVSNGTGNSTARGSMITTPSEMGAVQLERVEMEGSSPSPGGGAQQQQPQHSRTVSETSVGKRVLFRRCN